MGGEIKWEERSPTPPLSPPCVNPCSSRVLLAFLDFFCEQSLLLLHYLIRNGSERVVTNAREHVYDMKPLEEYTFRDEHGKDQGINGECGVSDNRLVSKVAA